MSKCIYLTITIWCEKKSNFSFFLFRPSMRAYFLFHKIFPYFLWLCKKSLLQLRQCFFLPQTLLVWSCSHRRFGNCVHRQLHHIYTWHRGLVECKLLNCHICRMLSVSEVELKFKLPEKWCHIWTHTYAGRASLCCIRTCWCNGLVNVHCMKMSCHFPPSIRFSSEVQKANRLSAEKSDIFSNFLYFFQRFLDSFYMRRGTLRTSYAKIFIHMQRVGKCVNVWVCAHGNKKIFISRFCIYNFSTLMCICIFECCSYYFLHYCESWLSFKCCCYFCFFFCL